MTKEYRCPEYVIALLEHLEYELTRIQENITQEDYYSPFSNSGSEFKTDVFEARAYYWGDDESEIDKPNFKCGNFEISWYKHLGRDTTINRRITPRKAIKIFNKCMKSLYDYEWQNDDSLNKYGQPTTLEDIRGNQRLRPNLFTRLRLKWQSRHEH